MVKTSSQGNHLSYGYRVTLTDGREVSLRPIRETDGQHLIDLFNRISPQHRYLRFLRDLPELPEDLLYHFTHLDYDSTFALVALVEEGGKDAVIAVGRYAYDPGEKVTDLAIAVRDDWQRLGLGKALLAKIIAVAKEHGISRFVSMMDPWNNFICRTLRGLGYEVKLSLRQGYYQVEILV